MPMNKLSLFPLAFISLFVLRVDVNEKICTMCVIYTRYYAHRGGEKKKKKEKVAGETREAKARRREQRERRTRVKEKGSRSSGSRSSHGQI